MLTEPLPSLAVEVPRDGRQNHCLKHISIVHLELLPNSPALQCSPSQQDLGTVHIASSTSVMYSEVELPCLL